MGFRGKQRDIVQSEKVREGSLEKQMFKLTSPKDEGAGEGEGRGHVNQRRWPYSGDSNARRLM